MKQDYSKRVKTDKTQQHRKLPYSKQVKQIPKPTLTSHLKICVREGGDTKNNNIQREYEPQRHKTTNKTFTKTNAHL